MLLAPIWGLDERVSQLRLRGIPVVLLDRSGNASDFCSVSVDDVEGGRLAAEHLLDQGHRKIALVGGPGNLQQVRDRRLGAELANARHDGSAQLLVISTAASRCRGRHQGCRRNSVAPDWERRPQYSRQMTCSRSVCSKASSLLDCRSDAIWRSYDDIAFAAAAAVPLSSIRQPRLAIGYRGAELLFDEIEANERMVPTNTSRFDLPLNLSYGAQVQRAAIFRHSSALPNSVRKPSKLSPDTKPHVCVGSFLRSA